MRTSGEEVLLLGVIGLLLETVSFCVVFGGGVVGFVVVKASL